jgi:hypothetical protein
LRRYSNRIPMLKKIHPDQRRPAYPAALVNEAKDVLRRHHRKLRTLVRLTNSWRRRWFWRYGEASSSSTERLDRIVGASGCHCGHHSESRGLLLQKGSRPYLSTSAHSKRRRLYREPSERVEAIRVNDFSRAAAVWSIPHGVDICLRGADLFKGFVERLCPEPRSIR